MPKIFGKFLVIFTIGSVYPAGYMGIITTKGAQWKKRIPIVIWGKG